MQLPRIPQIPQHSHGEGGGERWLISYADMITLLLVLFIILYSTAQQDLAKFEALSKSLSEGFGASTPNMAPIDNENTGGAGDNVILDKSTGGDSPLEMFAARQTPIQIFQFAQMLEDQSDLRRELDEIVEEALDHAQRQLGMGELEGGLTVTHSERGIVIEIHPDQILFDPGSAQLKPAFKEVLKVLAKQLARLPNDIEVQGHTDSLPISTAAYPSNWELSAARAGAVIRHFQNLGLDSSRLSAAGYADTRPLGNNETREGRATNRRVEIVILRQQGEDSTAKAAAAEPADEHEAPTGHEHEAQPAQEHEAAGGAHKEPAGSEAQDTHAAEAEEAEKSGHDAAHGSGADHAAEPHEEAQKEKEHADGHGH
ncbi:OmpA family protein [bacterium]|nr:OmpA family protein [bacterium]